MIMNAARLAPENSERRQSCRIPTSTITSYEVMNMLTQQRLKELIQYDPVTGKFYRPTKSGAKECGTASTHSNKQYLRIWVAGKLYYAHRLAWLYMTGAFPKDQIDHIDGNGLNNVFTNLRDVTCQVNNKNRRLSSNNSSGITGVHWCEERQKWVSQIKHFGKIKHLGRFNEIEDAKGAREQACEELGFHENHGLKREDNNE